MTSSEKRRMIAARLRILASHREVDKEMFHDAIGVWQGECLDGYDPVNVMELADLIEPATCRFEWSETERGLTCSNCGETVSCDEPGYAYRVTEETAHCFDCCPMCGAKVVGE